MSVPLQRPATSKQDYQTPSAFIAATKRFLGIDKFCVDLAASKENAQADTFITEAEDSLKVDWAPLIGQGEWAWLNPPYRKLAPWAMRCNIYAHRGCKIAMLVPASVGSNWFATYVHDQAHVVFLNGRLAFMPDKPKWLFPKDTMLILWGWQDRMPSLPYYEVWNWRRQL